MLELKCVERRKWNRNGTRYEDEIYTIGGYTVRTSIGVNEDGSKNRYIYVNTTNWRGDETGTNRYLPDICFDDGIGSIPPKFSIQTISYGSLDTAEYTTFLEAQRIALEVATTLTEHFLDK